MDTKALTYREPKAQQSKSLTYYVQRIEDLQVNNLWIFFSNRILVLILIYDLS